MTEEQARAIAARILNFPPGGCLPSCQTLAPSQQAQQIRGARGRGSRGRRGGRGGDRGGRGRGDAGGRSQIPPPPYRRAEQQKGHEAGEGREETFQAEDEEGGKVEGDRDGETPRGALFEVTRVGGDMPPPEGNTDLPGFHPEHSHLLLKGVYGDFPHHKNGSHLDGGS